MGPEMGTRATTPGPDRAVGAVMVERGERPGNRPAAGCPARADIGRDGPTSVPRVSRCPPGRHGPLGRLERELRLRARRPDPG